MNLIKIVLFSALLFIGFVCFGQNQQMRFKNLSVNDGLSQSWVRCIAQDKYGFIWIGTDDGLNRYDGNNFVVYKQDLNDSTSLNGTIIFSIFEDSKGNLWIGTIRGLNLYDRQNDRFIQKDDWPKFRVKSIIEDKEHNLWIGAGSGIYCINAKTQQTVNYSNTHPFWQHKSINVTKLLIDKKDNFWIATQNDGLILFDREKNTFENVLQSTENKNNPLELNINTIAEDKDGRIWIGSKTGMFLLETPIIGQSKLQIKLLRLHTDQKIDITNSSVLAISVKNNKLWFGIEDGGLGLIDLNDYQNGILRCKNYRNQRGIANSLSNNSIHSIFRDKQDIIWIGTYSKGVDIINPFPNRFAHYTCEQNINSLIDSHVNAFCEDGNYVWIGTEDGLDRFNKSDRSFKHYTHSPANTKSIISNAISAICKDNNEHLWLGTRDGGLLLFNYRSETFINYRFQKSDDPSNNISSILDNKDGKLWICTLGGGLLLFDTHFKTFQKYTDFKTSNTFETLIKTSNGEIWVKNGNQKNQFIEKFDAKTGNFYHFTDTSGKSILSGSRVYSILEDGKHNIWVGTNAGLNKFVRESASFISYTEKDGLADNSVRSLIEDNSGNLWMGTNRGLCKMEENLTNPQKPKFRNFILQDGIQDNDFITRSCLKGSDGTLYFGGTNGFNSFYPDSIKVNLLIPNVVITDFLLFNKSVKAGTKNSPLQKSIIDTRQITLPYDQTVIGFRFSALNYIIPEKNQYAFMLEGFEKQWNYIGNKHEATYTNLSPGTYHFLVKASNNDGVWNDNGATIEIIILPPWWKTTWFRMLSITLLMLVLGLLIYSRINAYNKRQQELSELVKQRTLELEETNIELLQEKVIIAEQQETLLMANTSLQAQNQRIEEYAEEVNSQNEELKMANEQLLEQQTRIEEQSEELAAHSENLKEVNELLIEKQNLIQMQSKILEESNQELSLINSTKDRLFSIIAHDLRNPFHALIGFSEILINGFKKMSLEKMEHFLNLIYKSAINGNALLENLLQWSRAQTGKIVFQPENFDMYIISKEVISMLEADAMRKNIKLILDVEPNTTVFADANMIRTVLRNLISNAIKFTNEQGIISIKSLKSQSNAEFTIADSGVGIPETKINLLFRVETNITTKGTASEPGTGLGLILCKEFVEKNAGKIWVESEIGKGSEFKFTLPFE